MAPYLAHGPYFRAEKTGAQFTLWTPNTVSESYIFDSEIFHRGKLGSSENTIFIKFVCAVIEFIAFSTSLFLYSVHDKFRRDSFLYTTWGCCVTTVIL